MKYIREQSRDNHVIVQLNKIPDENYSLFHGTCNPVQIQKMSEFF